MNDDVLPSPDQLTPPVQWEVEWPVPGWDNLGLTTDDHCLLLLASVALVAFALQITTWVL